MTNLERLQEMQQRATVLNNELRAIYLDMPSSLYRRDLFSAIMDATLLESHLRSYNAWLDTEFAE